MLKMELMVTPRKFQESDKKMMTMMGVTKKALMKLTLRRVTMTRQWSPQATAT